MRTIFQLKNSDWVFYTYACDVCGQTFKTTKYCSKHEERCININNKKKEKEKLDMPIQRIMKNGEAWYRWGDHGKLYKDRHDAEKQAAAAYASGYKKKKK